MKHRFRHIFIASLTLIFFAMNVQLNVFASPSPQTFTDPLIDISVNGTESSTTWTLDGTKPTKLEGTEAVGFEFFDSEPIDFSLTTSLQDIPAGLYNVTIEAFIQTEVTPDSGLKVTTYKDSIPQTKTIEMNAKLSSWANPREYSLYSVEVGSNGQINFEWGVEALNGGYGYIRSITLDEMTSLPEVDYLTINDVSPNWSLLSLSASHLEGSNDLEDLYSGIEYQDSESISLHLASTVQLQPNTSYSFKSFGKASSSLNQTSKVKVTTTNGVKEHQLNLNQDVTPINVNSFFETGHNGLATIEIIIEAASSHSGYITAINLVEDKPLDDLDVYPSTSLLRTNKTQQLIHDSDTNSSYTYSSSNSNVATVDTNGMVTALSQGETTITVAVYTASILSATGTSKIVVSDSIQSLQNYDPIQVEPVQKLQNGHRSDFIMGADVSTIKALQDTGRKFYDEYGAEQPFMSILNNSGVNWIRIRSWVDPFDVNGHSYGAGTLDKENTVLIANQAVSAGLDVLLDIHYSDFWTDPARQSIPKSWANLSEVELLNEVYTYTYDLLEEMSKNNATPKMVQIGNEINGGFLWPLSGTSDTPNGKGISNAVPYLEKGIEAVRDFEEDYSTGHIDIVLHRTNLNDGLEKVIEFYDELTSLDYDVIGLSYYPFWHGSVENMQSIMNGVASKYNKKVSIVEMSYAYSLEDPLHNGTTGNSFGQSHQEIGGYLATLQGQTNAIRDVINAIANIPNDMGIGIFYWEPAWLPGIDVPWGTSYAAAYQGETIGGNEGSAWVNQALFNQFGEKLPSLDVFKRVRDVENYTAPTVISVSNLSLTTNEGQSSILPSSVKALYSDDQYRSTSVISWSPQSYDIQTPGTYELVGEIQGGKTFNATVTVRPLNYVVNAGLELEDTSAWHLTNASVSTEEPYTGTRSIHFWDAQQVLVKQMFTNLPNGEYALSAYTRVGFVGDPIDATSRLYAKTSSTEFSSRLVETGWQYWQRITVNNIIVTDGQLEIGVVVDNAVGDYGDFDDFELILIERESSPTPSPTPLETTLPASTLVGIGFIPSSEQDYSVSIGLDTGVHLTESLLSGLTNEQLTLIFSDVILKMNGSEINGFSSLHFDRHANPTSLTSPNEGQFTVLSSFSVQANSNQALSVSLANQTNDSTNAALYYIDENGRLVFAGGYWIDEEYVVALKPNKTYVFVQNSKDYFDVNEQSEAVRFFTAAGVISGDQNNDLQLNRQGTRLEFAKMINGLVGHSVQDSQSSTEHGFDFEDVPASSWGYAHVNAVTKMGLMKGIGSQSFGASESITAEQLFVVFARAMNIQAMATREHSSLSGWAVGSIDALIEKGYISEQELAHLDLRAPLSRDDMFSLLLDMYKVFSLK